MKDLEELRKLIQENATVTTPTDVRIVGTSFGNELQIKILTRQTISNWLLFYLCAFATFRYFMMGN